MEHLRKYLQLQAELGSIEKLLKEFPEDSVIDRLGLESRKKEVEEKISELGRQAVSGSVNKDTKLTHNETMDLIDAAVRLSGIFADCEHRFMALETSLSIILDAYKEIVGTNPIINSRK